MKETLKEKQAQHYQSGSGGQSSQALPNTSTQNMNLTENMDMDVSLGDTTCADLSMSQGNFSQPAPVLELPPGTQHGTFGHIASADNNENWGS